MTSQKIFPKNLSVLLVILLALGVRLVGIGYGLPHLYHQDEPIIVNHAMAMGVTGWNSHFFVIPPFAASFLFVLYGVYFLAGSALGIFSDKLQFAASFLSDPSAFYLIGRLSLGVLFGVGTVVLVGIIGKRIFSERVGFFAMLFLALAGIHVQHSHYIYADIAVTFSVTALLFFLLRIITVPSYKNFVMAGIMFGWAVSIKYTALYFLPAILATFIVAFGNQIFQARNFGKILISGSVSLIVFALIAPYTFLDWKSFWGQMTHQAGAEGMVGIWHHFNYSVIRGTGALFSMFSIFGLIFLWRSRKREAVVIGSFVLFYYLVNSFFSQHFARYMMPLIPVMALLAVFGWEEFSSILGAGKRIKNVLLFLLLIELAAPVFYGDRLFLQKDTRTACLEWFDKNTAQNSVVVVDNRSYAPRLTPSREQILDMRQWVDASDKEGVKGKRLDLMLEAVKNKKTYNIYTLWTAEKEPDEKIFLFLRPFVAPDRAELEKIKADYLVINYTEMDPAVQRLKESAKNKLELAAVFSPYRNDAQKEPLDKYATTAAPHTLADLFSRKTLGPYLEVYKVRGEQ